MTMQSSFLQDLQASLEQDVRVRAAWLGGSLGRGDADRYSDIDLHLLLPADQLAAFRRDAEQWLNALRPLLLFRWMFNGDMINALADNGLRLDVWIHGGDHATIDPARTSVLKEQPALLHRAATPWTGPDAEQLLSQIAEFWRCIALMPCVLGRKEKIVAWMGITVEQGIVTNLLLDGYGVARDTGVKKLNPFLPADQRLLLEDALNLQGLSLSELAAAQFKLAAIVQHHGRQIAARHGFAYPDRLEEGVLAYVASELGPLGLTVPTDRGMECAP